LTAGASVHIADVFTRLSAERLRDWLLAEPLKPRVTAPDMTDTVNSARM